MKLEVEVVYKQTGSLNKVAEDAQRQVRQSRPAASRSGVATGVGLPTEEDVRTQGLNIGNAIRDSSTRNDLISRGIIQKRNSERIADLQRQERIAGQENTMLGGRAAERVAIEERKNAQVAKAWAKHDEQQKRSVNSRRDTSSQEIAEYERAQDRKVKVTEKTYAAMRKAYAAENKDFAGSTSRYSMSQVKKIVGMSGDKSESILAAFAQVLPYEAGLPLGAARGVSRLLGNPALSAALPIIGGVGATAIAGTWAANEALDIRRDTAQARAPLSRLGMASGVAGAQIANVGIDTDQASIGSLKEFLGVPGHWTTAGARNNAMQGAGALAGSFTDRSRFADVLRSTMIQSNLLGQTPGEIAGGYSKFTAGLPEEEANEITRHLAIAGAQSAMGAKLTGTDIDSRTARVNADRIARRETRLAESGRAKTQMQQFRLPIDLGYSESERAYQIQATGQEYTARNIANASERGREIGALNIGAGETVDPRQQLAKKKAINAKLAADAVTSLGEEEHRLSVVSEQTGKDYLTSQKAFATFVESRRGAFENTRGVKKGKYDEDELKQFAISSLGGVESYGALDAAKQRNDAASRELETFQRTKKSNTRKITAEQQAADMAESERAKYSERAIAAQIGIVRRESTARSELSRIEAQARISDDPTVRYEKTISASVVVQQLDINNINARRGKSKSEGGLTNAEADAAIDAAKRKAKDVEVLAEVERRIGESQTKRARIQVQTSVALERPGLSAFGARSIQTAGLVRERGALPVEATEERARLGIAATGLAEQELYEQGSRGFSVHRMASEARKARRQVERGLRRRDAMFEQDAYDRSHIGRAQFNDPDVRVARQQASGQGDGSNVSGSAAQLMLQAAQLMLQAAHAGRPGRGGGRDYRAMGVPTN